MELTTMTVRRRRGVRGWLRGDGPPSLRATLFLAFSTFLCGCVLASLLFVGIWRHTAGEAARTRAAEARTRAVQQHDRQQLLAARTTLARLAAQLAHTRSLLSGAEGRARSATTALAHARAAELARARSLTPRLQALVDTAVTLARQTSTIESELTALQRYAQDPGATGVDPGYLEAQARYLSRTAAAAAAAAAALTRQTRDAQASLPA